MPLYWNAHNGQSQGHVRSDNKTDTVETAHAINPANIVIAANPNTSANKINTANTDRDPSLTFYHHADMIHSGMMMKANHLAVQRGDGRCCTSLSKLQAPRIKQISGRP